MKRQVTNIIIWCYVAINIPFHAMGQACFETDLSETTIPKEMQEVIEMARGGMVEDALTLLEGRDRIGDIPMEGVLYKLATTLKESGHQEMSEKIFGRLQSSFLSDLALLQLSDFAISRNEYELARRMLAKISPTSSYYFTARLKLAWVLKMEGRFGLGLNVLSEIMKGSLTKEETYLLLLGLIDLCKSKGDQRCSVDSAISAFLLANNNQKIREASSLLKELGIEVSPILEIVRRIVNAKRTQMLKLLRDKNIAKLDLGLTYLLKGLTFRDFSKYKDAEVMLEKAVENTKDPLVRSLATLSLCAVKVRIDKPADDCYEKAIKESPPFSIFAKHAYGRYLMRVGKYDLARKAFSDVISSENPNLVNIGLWDSAILSILSGSLESALFYLDEMLRREARGDGILFGLAEKATYFRGIVHYGRGDKKQAVEDMVKVARSFPHSYYGVLAVSRLKEWGIAIEEGRSGLLTSISAPSNPDILNKVKACGVAKQSLVLWRIGYPEEAVKQLKRLARLGFLDEKGLLVLAQMESNKKNMGIREVLRGIPDHETQPLFVQAYPRPFLSYVEEASEMFGIDAGLIFGLMRAESNFNPNARSYKGAVGLMQILPETAKLVANRIVDQPKLAKGIYLPRTNIILGTGFLAELDKHFRGCIPLMLTGYNAGPQAGRKFYNRFKHLPLDLFVEIIPYSATSEYIKNVISYTSGYRFLYEQGEKGRTILPVSLPETLGPFLDKKIKSQRISRLNPDIDCSKIMCLVLEEETW